MREFPSKFIGSNLPQFEQYKYDRDICYLREGIYEHYLHEKKESKGSIKPYETPYDLEKFQNTRNPPRFEEMIKTLCEELAKLGWKTFIGHNKTAMWIYPANEKPPKSLPEW